MRCEECKKKTRAVDGERNGHGRVDLDAGAAHLAVPLCKVHVADGEERAVAAGAGIEKKMTST